MASGSFHKILRTGFLHMWRNGLVTFASLVVMSLTLFLIAFVIFVNALVSFTLGQIAERVDVNVYFTTSATEEIVLDVQDQLTELPEVVAVEYVSRDKAIEDFRLQNADEPLIIQGLEELGVNPLGPSLNVRAIDAGGYAKIAEFLGEDGELDDTTFSTIDTVNYYENEEIISRISSLSNWMKRLVFVFAVVFGALAVIMTINTLRLAMYASREEISVMRLVGADSRFIQGPFYAAGMLYGVIAGMVTLIILYPLTTWVSRHTIEFFGGFNLFDYFTHNFIWLVLIVITSGIVLGVISSAIAIRSYLRR